MSGENTSPSQPTQQTCTGQLPIHLLLSRLSVRITLQEVEREEDEFTNLNFLFKHIPV